MGDRRETQVTIKHDGRETYGIFITPEKSGPHPVVIFSHGYNGSGDDFLTFARFLVSNNISAFCHDFCGGSVTSRSSMETTDMTIFTEKEDLRAVISYLQKSGQIDKNNIFIFGGSMGGLVSALVAEDISDEIRGLILMYPAVCIADTWNRIFPEISDIPKVQDVWGMNLGNRFFEALHDYNIYEHLGKYNKKVLVVHGDCDDIVPLEYAVKLKDVYKNIDLHIFEEEGHGFSEAGMRRLEKLAMDYIGESIVK